MKGILKWIGISLLILGISFIYFDNNPEFVSIYPSCIIYEYTGFYCPGCGSQRAAYHFLNFNFLQALNQNILFIFGILLLIYFLVIKAFNILYKKKCVNFLEKPFVIYILLGFTIIFWILRNIPFYPFTYLAPK